MEIRRIFALDNDEGIHAIVYDENDSDEFERLFDDWNDTEYIAKYLIENKAYLDHHFFQGKTIDTLISQVLDEAEKLEKLIYEYASGKIDKTGKTLEMLFKPLNNNEYALPVLQSTKGLVPKYINRTPLLRIYALRLAENCFIVTGGAIKITHGMGEHDDTDEELSKLHQCKAFLHQKGINIQDDLIYYYDESE